MDNLVYYVNGKFVAARDAALGLNDLGIVRGYGVFDLLRTYEGKLFKLHEHVLRLQRSAAVIGMDLPWSTAEIEAIAHATYARNVIANATIRIIVTGGAADDFMTPQQRPSLVVMVNPIDAGVLEQQTQGVKVITTRIERMMPTVKSLNYMTAIMAMQAAKRVGAVEAIYRTRTTALPRAHAPTSLLCAATS